jgi:hypothetical protein
MPDTFAQWYRDHAEGAAPSEALGRHMKRELMHAVWHHMLDDEFLLAYEKGTSVTFTDGVKRLVFSRIFTYTADYLEK